MIVSMRSYDGWGTVGSDMHELRVGCHIPNDLATNRQFLCHIRRYVAYFQISFEPLAVTFIQGYRTAAALLRVCELSGSVFCLRTKVSSSSRILIGWTRSATWVSPHKVRLVHHSFISAREEEFSALHLTLCYVP